MRRALYIGLVLLLAASCGPRVIKRAKMERIIADMLVQDQQVKLDLALRKQADTCLVYEGIFEQYGYTTDDFLLSVRHYLSDPSRMEKIMGNVAENLESRAKKVKAVIDLEEWRKGYLRIHDLPADTVSHFPKPRPQAVDSLCVRFQGDTIYFHVADTLR